MKNFKILIACFFVTLCFVSCSTNDDNYISDHNISKNFGNTTSRTFIGQVVDSENIPLKDVTVKIGNSTVQTDDNGIFIINNAIVYEKFAFITTKKTGYIDGSRSIIPTAGKNNVRIMMYKHVSLETVQSGTVSEVSISSGTKVKFDGFFQNDNGSAYFGDVQVSVIHLTPSEENIGSLMPGMLYAERENGDEAALETFGMIHVELRGSAGQKLNIANGHTADITIRIDDTQLATAPSTIPLWHFDEESGYWKEDGVATKIGNKYVGSVSHFSWWSFNLPFPGILLTTTFLNASGNPLSNVRVTLLSNTSVNSPSVYTDTNGQVSIFTPIDETFSLIVSTICTTFYTTTIGPFSADTVLPDFLISTALTTNVIGSLLKCDGSEVTNGYVLLTSNGCFSYAPVTNGIFNFTKLYNQNDNNQFTIIGVDFEENQFSTILNLSFTTPVTNVQSILSCNTINNYMTYQIDNGPTENVTGLLYLYAFGNIGQEKQINAYAEIPGPNTAPSSSFTFYNILQPGIYTTFSEGLIINGTGYNLYNKVFTVTSMGGGGQYFEATLDANYNEFQTTIAHSIQIKFHIFRP